MSESELKHEVGTKHEVIEQYYIEQMKNKSVKPGEKLPAESEIAEIFGVSRHTVRQALAYLSQEGWIIKERGKGSFFSEKKEEVRQKNIAVLTTYLSDYIFPKIIEGIEQELRSKGYNLLLFNSNNDQGSELQCLERITNQEIMGVIVEPAQSAINELDEVYLKRLVEKDIKCLAINAPYLNYNSAYVLVDDEQGGYKLTKYLLELGHTRIAGLFKVDDMQGIKRREGYIRALKEQSIEVDDELIGGYVTDNQGVYVNQFIKHLTAYKEKPTAIVCYNDKIALRVIGEVRAEEVKVPEELSVVSFDDSSAAVSSDIKLTTISHPKRELGIRAAKCMIDMIEGRMVCPQYTYGAKLIVRESCTRVGM